MQILYRSILRNAGLRIFSVLLSILIIISFLIATALPAFASSSEQAISIFVSLYNDKTQEFYLQNTQIKLQAGSTTEDTLSVLKESDLISDFIITSGVGGSITSVTLTDGTALNTLPPPDSQVFYIKLNGVVQPPQLARSELKEGDILEIIYGDRIKTVIVPSESSNEAEATASTTTITWDEAHQEILSDACDYLNLNAEASTQYLVAIGCAGRSPDLRKLNSALGAARRSTEATSAGALANAILTMTFTGYDASTQVARLADIPSENGVETAIGILTAYDSYSYEVDPEAANTRSGLVRYLLSSQNENGAFTDGTLGRTETTATIVALLSRYRGQSGVPQAIDKAVSYLADRYISGVGFENSSTADSKLTSKVIVALISAELGVYDERFVSDEKTLLDLLIERRNPDGGFSIAEGSPSNVDATIQAVIALSAIKKNKYPYTVSQKLAPPTKITQQLVDKVKSLSIEDLVLLGVVIVTAVVVIIISLTSRFSRKTRA